MGKAIAPAAPAISGRPWLLEDSWRIGVEGGVKEAPPTEPSSTSGWPSLEECGWSFSLCEWL